MLKRGRVKSEFLKLYRFSLSPFRLKRSGKYFGSRLFLALNIRIAISCNLLLKESACGPVEADSRMSPIYC